MYHKTKVKTLISVISVTAMLITDYILGSEAEYLNLYHLLLALFSQTDKNYIFFQDRLGGFALTFALGIVSLFHFSITNVFYYLINKTIMRNHEKA